MKKALLLLPMLLAMFSLSVNAQITVFSEGFEDGVLPAGWTNIDADNDGNTWVHNSTTFVDGHESDGAFVSFSKLNGAALTPDNWLVTPAIPLAGNSTLTFWRMSSFSTPQEHYGIFVSTTSATDLTSFTQVFEETLPSYHWMEKTVDLSAYAGQTVYIAFRHYNCTNLLAFILDDITVTTTSASPIITVVPSALQFFNVQEGFPSVSQMVTVNANNVTNAITAVAGDPFEVSLDNVTFSSSVTMSGTDTAVYVRYYPTYESNDTAYLTLSDGTVSTTVLLTGNSIACDITLPYMQNFDDAPQFGLPGCWSRINAYNGYPRATSEYGTGGNDKVLMFNCDHSTYEPVYAVMPLMPVNLSDLQITFSTFREGQWSGTFSVGYVSDITDTSSFVPVWSITGPQIGDNNPHSYMVSFADVESDPNIPFHITFKYQPNNNYGSIWYWFVDDITVDEISTCAPPSNLETTAVTSSSATLNWSGNSDSYNLYYKAAADTGWTQVQNVVVDENGYLLENLLSNTTYTWFVAAICDDGTTSNSMENTSFTTDCGNYLTPFLQEFDASSSFPNCWHRYTGLASEIFTGTALTPTTSNYSGWRLDNTHVFGARHASLNIYGTGTKYWLVTPPIDLSALASPTLTFDLALTKYNTTNPIDNPNAQGDDKFMVIVSTDHGITWSAANATVWSNDGNGDYVFNQIPAAGQEITIPLTNYAGQTVMIAFYGESTVTGNGDNDLHIDNVMVDNASACARPNNLTVTTVTDNSVTLTWTESGTATAWNIEYGPVGFTPGTGDGTVVAATSNPFTVTNLSGIPYHFYVQSNCGDAQSFWTGPVAATPGTYNMGITGSDTLTTCSTIIYDNGGANGDYSDNCDFTLVLFPENEGELMTVSGTYVTENNWDYLRIYDSVGTSGTLLGEYCGNGSVPTLVSSSGPLTVKFTSDVSSHRSGFVLTTNCAACMPPTNLTLSNVGSETAVLTWAGSADTYLVEYKAYDDTEWITENLSDTTYNLANLAANTTYTVNLYSACDNEGYSPAASISFTTTMNTTSLPYSTDFSSDNDQWLFNNGSCNNFWKIGSVNDSTTALFVTDNNSIPKYNVSSFSAVSAEKIFTIGEATDLLISFDVNVGGESTFDYLKVFFAPADSLYPAINTNIYYAANNYSNFALNFSDYIQYGGSISFPYIFNLTDGNIVHVSATMPNPNTNPTAASTAKLVFLWKNDQSQGTQPAAIIYNVSIQELSCPKPTNLAATNLTTNSAEINWMPGGEETDWILEYKESADTVWTTTNVSGSASYLLNGLVAGATYQVRVQAICGSDNQSLWASTLFNVPCDAFTTFPYTEDFEHNGALPECWSQEYVIDMINWTVENGTQSSTGIENAHSGNYNAYFYSENYNGSVTRLVSPIFDLSGITNPYLSYWYAQKPWGNSQDHLSVFYRTSSTSEWQMLVIYASAANEWTMDSIALPNPTATYQIAFTGDAAEGYGIVLDDITIAAAGTNTEPCDAPAYMSFAEEGITQTSAVASWPLDNSVPSWTLQYKAAEDVNWTEVTSNHPWYTINGLTPNTTYQARVRANCSDGGMSEWTAIVTFTTLSNDTPVPCEAPTGLTATNVENHAISIAWDANADVNNWNIRYRVANGDWSTQTSSTNSYTITDLEGLTTYLIQVQANCGDNGLSEWSNSITAQTTNVGIESQLASNVTLYPNPANDVVNVQCTMNNVQLEDIEVIDVYGKVVRTVVETLRATSLPTCINVSGLANGMYFVRVTTNEGTVTKSFVKK
jgi:hypothetical protein